MCMVQSIGILPALLTQFHIEKLFGYQNGAELTGLPSCKSWTAEQLVKRNSSIKIISDKHHVVEEDSFQLITAMSSSSGLLFQPDPWILQKERNKMKAVASRAE